MAKKQTKQTPIDLSDIFTGLVASLAERQIHALEAGNLRWSYAFEMADKTLTPQIEDLGLNRRYRIHRNIHGDSNEVFKELIWARQRDLISVDCPLGDTIRIKVQRSVAPQYMEGLPGNPQLYRDYTSEFLKHFREFIPGRGM